MKEYSAKQIKQLRSNPYTKTVTKYRLFFTEQFKEKFWISYQAGNTPRKILTDLGYDVSIFGQKQIDSIAQRIKREALSGEGFKEGPNRTSRIARPEVSEQVEMDPKALEYMRHEVIYLRQEVEYIKKIIKIDQGQRKG